MTKKEMIEIMVQRMNQKGEPLKKEHLVGIVECALEAFIDQLVTEGRIEIRGFGVFKLKKTSARMGRNPITGEVANVPAHVIVQFKPGSYMKKQVNGEE